METLFRNILAGSFICAALLIPMRSEAAQDCAYGSEICAVRASIYKISAYFPYGSAVRIGTSTLITNRHLVADVNEVEIIGRDGQTIVGQVVPTMFPGDLVLIEADLGPGPALTLDDDDDQGPYQSVGLEIATGKVRVYPRGRKLVLGDETMARLHHTAHAQPGNSGGALIDGEGELVAIIASGGQGINEAVPIRRIAPLKEKSGPQFQTESQAIGVSYRVCDDVLEEVELERGQANATLLSEMEEVCSETNNRQLIDLAAQAAGRARSLELSAALFERSLALDRNAVKTRLGYLTTLHLLGRYADEIPHIRALLDLIPEEPSLHRFAVQAGRWGGDEDLAQTGLKLVQQYNPQMVGAAKRFLDADVPPPRRLPNSPGNN